MVAKKKRLGRGLDSLLAGASMTAQPIAKEANDSELAVAEPVDGTLKYLPVEHLKTGKFQPRRDMDPTALEELSNSIKAQGLSLIHISEPTRPY